MNTDDALSRIEALARSGQGAACLRALQGACPLKSGLPAAADLERLLPLLVSVDPLPGRGVSAQLLRHLALSAAGPRRHFAEFEDWLNSPQQWLDLVALAGISGQLSPLGLNALAVGVLAGDLGSARDMLARRAKVDPDRSQQDYDLLKSTPEFVRKYAAWARVSSVRWKPLAAVVAGLLLFVYLVSVWLSAGAPTGGGP